MAGGMKHLFNSMTGGKKFFLIAATVLCVLSCNDALKIALDLKASTTPIAGGGGVLTVSAVTMDGFTVSWTAAQEGVTPSEKMKYLAYTSRSPNISTVAEAEQHGTAFGMKTQNITSVAISGLEDSVEYWLNVVVEDEAGNRSAYVMPTASTRTVKHQRIYWTDTALIAKADYDGANFVNVATGLATPLAISIDPSARKVYWSDITVAKILRADFNGANVEEVINANLATPRGLAIDYVNHYLYWTDSTNNAVYRSPLPPPSQNASDCILLDSGDGVDTPWGVDIDIAHGIMYWSERGASANKKRIRRADVNGSNLSGVVILADTDQPYDVAVMPGPTADQAMIYFADNGTIKKIRSTTTSGSVSDLINLNLQAPNSIAVDPDSRILFWTDQTRPGVYAYGLSQGSPSLDGNNYLLSIPGVTAPRGIDSY